MQEVRIEIGDNLKEVMMAVIDSTHPDHISGVLKSAFGLNLTDIAKASIEADARIKIEQVRTGYLPYGTVT